MCCVDRTLRQLEDVRNSSSNSIGSGVSGGERSQSTDHSTRDSMDSISEGLLQAAVSAAENK